MKPHSRELRQRIIAAKFETQASDTEIALRFRVSRSFVNKLCKQYQQKGSIEPLPHGGGASRKLNSEEIEFVIQLVREDSEATLSQIKARLTKETGKIVSISTISRILKHFKA
jgi:transposase